MSKPGISGNPKGRPFKPGISGNPKGRPPGAAEIFSFRPPRQFSTKWLKKLSTATLRPQPLCFNIFVKLRNNQMTNLDSKYWGDRRFGGMSPGNGGAVRTTVPRPTLDGQVPPAGGTLEPSPGQFPGSEPNGPASGEPIDPNRGGRGV
jgi:hypothetical protein